MGEALEIEIENWYQTLPPTIRFDRNINVNVFSAHESLVPLIEHNVAMLRGSYMAILGMACWESVFTAATLGFPETVELPDEHRDAVRKFQLTFMRYVASARQYLNDKFHPMVWVQLQR
jgi:hypothetical protein